MVEVDSIISINPNLRLDRIQARKRGFTPPSESVVVPPGQLVGRVSQASIDKYIAYKEGVCADILITTLLENGTPAILAIKRAKQSRSEGCGSIAVMAVTQYGESLFGLPVFICSASHHDIIVSVLVILYIILQRGRARDCPCAQGDSSFKVSRT